MTNFERIKSMSLEEMAHMIDNAEEGLMCKPCCSSYCEGYSEDGLCPAENKDKFCRKATLKWLQAESVTDNNQK